MNYSVITMVVGPPREQPPWHFVRDKPFSVRKLWCDKRYQFLCESDRRLLAYEATVRDPDILGNRLELLFLNMKIKELKTQIMVSAAECRQLARLRANQDRGQR